MPPDLQLAVVASVIGLIVAAFSIRGLSPNSPNWAVRIYAALLSLPFPFGVNSKYRQSRRTFGRREAFLASWFLTFFVIFMIGLSFLPS